MPRPKLDKTKNKTVCLRMTDEMNRAVETFARDIDADNRTEAITKAIEYGILYYYYTKDSHESEV